MLEVELHRRDGAFRVGDYRRIEIGVRIGRGNSNKSIEEGDVYWDKNTTSY